MSSYRHYFAPRRWRVLELRKECLLVAKIGLVGIVMLHENQRLIGTQMCLDLCYSLTELFVA